jgi:hypothetical protein
VYPQTVPHWGAYIDVVTEHQSMGTARTCVASRAGFALAFGQRRLAERIVTEIAISHSHIRQDAGKRNAVVLIFLFVIDPKSLVFLNCSAE